MEMDLEGKWRTWSTSGRRGGNLLVVAIVERPAEAFNRGSPKCCR
jgi:hypothetical protein